MAGSVASWPAFATLGLTEELSVVISKPTPDARLGATLATFKDDCGYPRVAGAPLRGPRISERSPNLQFALARAAALKPDGLGATSGKLFRHDVVIKVNGKDVAGTGGVHAGASGTSLSQYPGALPSQPGRQGEGD